MSEWEEKYAALMNEFIHMETAFIELQKDYADLQAKLALLIEKMIPYMPIDVVQTVREHLNEKLGEMEKKPNPFKVVE